MLLRDIIHNKALVELGIPSTDADRTNEMVDVLGKMGKDEGRFEKDDLMKLDLSVRIVNCHMLKRC